VGWGGGRGEGLWSVHSCARMCVSTISLRTCPGCASGVPRVCRTDGGGGGHRAGPSPGATSA